jgi:hypothetical protein
MKADIENGSSLEQQLHSPEVYFRRLLSIKSMKIKGKNLFVDRADLKAMKSYETMNR